MTSRLSMLVHVDVVAVAVRREELDAELAEELVHPRLVRRNPLAAQLVGLPAELRVPQPAADAVASLEHDDVASFGEETPRGGQTSDAGTDDHDVGLDQAGAHAS